MNRNITLGVVGTLLVVGGVYAYTVSSPRATDVTPQSDTETSTRPGQLSPRAGILGETREEVMQLQESAAADDTQSTESSTTGRRVPTLDLSSRGLIAAPKTIFDHTELVVLDLSHNALTGTLPAEVRHLQNLERLDLSHNQFTGVPAEVGQLSKLTYLDLSHNQLTGLPYELGNLQNLKTLVLTGNDYAEADLAIIREQLPASTQIVTQ